MGFDDILSALFGALAGLGILGAAFGMFFGPICLAFEIIELHQLWAILGTSLVCMIVGWIGLQYTEF